MAAVAAAVVAVRVPPSSVFPFAEYSAFPQGVSTQLPRSAQRQQEREEGLGMEYGGIPTLKSRGRRAAKDTLKRLLEKRKEYSRNREGRDYGEDRIVLRNHWLCWEWGREGRSWGLGFGGQEVETRTDSIFSFSKVGWSGKEIGQQLSSKGR